MPSFLLLSLFLHSQRSSSATLMTATSKACPSMTGVSSSGCISSHSSPAYI
uniref:Uncharacterized protein n=1 Tax=Arundo donax TaxID=35708 RepID=A0A0A9EJS0_ARUDO